MLELFERMLCQGGDLEQARSTLLNQVNIERTQRNAEIEHDFKIATLIRECLNSEPKGSAGYAVSKGIMNRLKEKYANPEIQKVCRKIYRDLKREERKEGEQHDTNKGNPPETTPAPIPGSDCSQAKVSEGVLSAEQGQAESMV